MLHLPHPLTGYSFVGYVHILQIIFAFAQTKINIFPYLGVIIPHISECDKSEKHIPKQGV